MPDPDRASDAGTATTDRDAAEHDASGVDDPDADDADDGLDARSVARGRAESAARNRLLDAAVRDGKPLGVADPWTLLAGGGLAVVVFVGLGGVELGDEDWEAAALGLRLAGAGVGLLVGVLARVAVARLR